VEQGSRGQKGFGEWGVRGGENTRLLLRRNDGQWGVKMKYKISRFARTGSHPWIY